MDLNIQIQNNEQCSFSLLDTTCGNNGYLPETSEEYIVNRFKYSDTVGLINLTINKVNETIDYYNKIDIHLEKPEELYISSQFDGWFTLTYIVIPSKDWIDNNSEHLSDYQDVYYSDGVSIYKIEESDHVEISIKDILSIEDTDNTTISRKQQDFMSICFLKRCFINICKQILYTRGFDKCKVNNSPYSQLSYNRDLLWMGINTVSYLSEFGQLAEAQRLLEILENDCNGICKSQYRESSDNGCGCS